MNELEWNKIDLLRFRADDIIFSHTVLNTHGNRPKDNDEKLKYLYHKFNSQVLEFSMNENSTFSKVKSHKQIEKELDEYLPKTVFSESEITKLIFPIVCKPDSGMSGLGIKKFNDFGEYNDFIENNKDAKFDLYSEYIVHEREFRALFYKDEVMLISERGHSEDSITIDNKKAEEKIQFKYIEQKIEGFPELDTITKIANKANEKYKLSLYSMDFFLTKDNKIKIIEFNSSTGLGPYKFFTLYEAIRNRINGQINNKEKIEIQKLKNIYLQNFHKDNKEVIEKSLMPIRHDKEIDKKLHDEINLNKYDKDIIDYQLKF